MRILLPNRRALASESFQWEKYWEPEFNERNPRAHLLGYLMALVSWFLLTYLVIVPFLGFVILRGIPVPGFLFLTIVIAPFMMLGYLARIFHRSAEAVQDGVGVVVEV